APMLVERAATRTALLQDRSIRPVRERWSELSVAVVGVGRSPDSEESAYPSVMGALPRSVRDDLHRRGVVGDLCAHMFNLNGRFVDHEASRRTLSISIADLRRGSAGVAAAGGGGQASAPLVR